MNKVVKSLLALAAGSTLALTAGLAWSDDMNSADAMKPPMPGAESKALEKYFGKTSTWTGTAAANALSPGSPEMSTHGKAVCRPLYGGFWYTCDVEETYGAGKDAMTWKGHMLVGYDMGEQRYRSMMADNMGGMFGMDGTLSGDTFVLETPNEVMMMGQKMKDRLTWTSNADGSMSFKDEHKVGDADWTLFESATMTAAAASHAKAVGK